MRQDIVCALRTFFKNPGFSAAALLALALGIGVNTAIFSIADGVFLRPLPFKGPDRLAYVWTRDEAEHQRERQRNPEFPQYRYSGVSGAAFLDWQKSNRVFSEMACYYASVTPRAALKTGGAAREVRLTAVTASFLPLLGVSPALGRSFTADEDKAGGPVVALISHALWQAQFGSRSDAVGEAVVLDGKPATIIGVMPPGFVFPESTEVWRPLRVGSNDGDMYRPQRNYRALARLRRGVTLEQARADITSVERAAAARDENAKTKNETALVVPVHEYLYGDMRTGALMLLGAVGFVLLIACANVANLTLARSAAHQRELAIRAALGAGRFRLMRQLFTESTLLAGIGAAAGLALAVWTLDALKTLLPANIPRAADIRIDARVLWYTLAATAATALLAGVVPALQSSRVDPHPALKEGARASSGRRRALSVLVGTEMALALVLLAAAGLMLNTFIRLLNADRGFEAQGRITARLSLPDDRYENDRRRTDFVRTVVEHARGIPGVRAAASVFPLPLSGAQQRIGITLEGRPTAPGVEGPSANYRGVTPDYFRAMGISLLRGRLFTDKDTTDSPKVVIVNQTMARTLWPGEDPIGKRFTILSGVRRPYEIIGVVNDVRHSSLEFESGPEMYLAYFQRPQHFTAFLVLNVAGGAEGVPAALRAQVAALDPELPVADIKTMEELVSASVAPRRFYLVLLAIFAGLAVALAATGIYGVIAYSVEERTREIGIRIAIGAEPGSVLAMVVRQGVRLAAAGTAFGLAGALALSRVLRAFLYGVKPNDPVTLAVVSVILLGVAALASWLPARRAAKVDPIHALRYE